MKQRKLSQYFKPVSVEEYKVAFAEIEREMKNKKQYEGLGLIKKIFQIQYSAPDRTLSASEIAQRIGSSKHHSPISRTYGGFGHKVSEKLGSFPIKSKNGKRCFWSILSDGEHRTDGKFNWIMHPEVAQALEELEWVNAEFALPEEIPSSAKEDLKEGAVHQITVNSYERNAAARQQCIAHYGVSCYVCGFDFEKRYGSLGQGYIHVHHEVPLSKIKKEYIIDPIADLKPVCPNCHAMIHKNNPPFTIEEIRNRLIA